MIRIVVIRSLIVVAGAIGIVLSLSAITSADPSSSANYQLQETVVGGSGLDFSQSTNYQTLQTSGVLGIGNSASSGFQVNNGDVTTGDPALTFAIDSASVSFGSFSAGSATVGTATFEVINYTSYGYVVQILGNPPTSTGGHTITAMSNTAPSQAGTEQFGINLVANTSPTSVGTNPDQGQFGFGTASSNYGTANNYRYVSGETIALAPKSSGTTIYTISYIINVNSLTPAGQYTAAQTLVCTGTY